MSRYIDAKNRLPKSAILIPLHTPSVLDEAAEKYSENILANNEDLQDAIEDAFKAGAEWMAGQGGSFENKVFSLNGRPMLDGLAKDCVLALEKAGAKSGDKVIVQIRKHEKD